MTPRRAVGAVVAASLLAGCGSGDGSALAPATQTVPIAVWSSPGGAGLAAMFPSTAGFRRCVIHGGGPAPGIRVPGKCQTSIERLAGGGQRVRLTQTWKASDFRGQDAPGTLLSYGWTFTLSAAGTVIGVRTGGDFPPQDVK